MRSRMSRFGLPSVLALVVATVGVATAPQAAAVDEVPFSVTIRHINCVDPCDDEGLESDLEDTPDFYVKVWIDGKKLPLPSDEDEPSSPRIEDDDIIDPIWTIPAMVPADKNLINVAIQVWDHDGSSGDDLADIDPRKDDNNLDFVVDRSTNLWTGDVTAPVSCSTGGGGGENDQPKAQLCFDVGGDRDGDGLLDLWEEFGYDDNGDGTIDVNLPLMGADPDHKDLFLEIDYTIGNTPTRAGVQAMRAAFAAAPMSAGSRAGEREAANGTNEDTFGVSAGPNPDGLPGITLHVDTGGLVDPGAREGQAAGTCMDGIDNGGDFTSDGTDSNCLYLDASVEDPSPNCTGGADDDGDLMADGQDPDCLVGDAVFANPNIGGGQFIPDPGACGIDVGFYGAKNAAGGQRPARRYLFRYSISAQQMSTCPKPSGGQGEIGGNDFIDFNHDGGTIMHEFGHTLNLHHGGEDENNCKPNYISVMNYDLQGAIPRVGGGGILDYSPPRRALDGSSRSEKLFELDEDELNENFRVDPTDAFNRFVYLLPQGMKLQWPLNLYPNWNGDIDFSSTDPSQGREDEVEANIDSDDAEGNPTACDNDDFDELEGADDWSFISLSFHGFGDASDSAVRPEELDVPTTEVLNELRTSLNTTDLEVTQTDAPDPVAAGTDLTYTVTVNNLGFNPADSVEVVDTLPADVTFKSSSTPCAHASGVVTCSLGSIGYLGSRTFTVTGSVPADLVYNNGGPKTITNSVQVRNLLGPDSASANNTSTANTQVVAVADVKITQAATTGPLEVLIGQAATASVAVTLENAGPSSPIDTVLTTTASGSTGVTVTPATATSAQNALAVGSSRSVSSQATLSCTSPGQKTVTLTSLLALKNAADTDPDLTNNTAVSSFTIDCVVPIAINIRPKGFPNSVNLNTDATVAALTTRAGEYGLPLDFNATRIVATTALWGLQENLFNVATPRGAREVHNAGHLERSYELDEKTRDADVDMVLHFKPADSGLTLSSRRACLKGKYTAPDGALYTFLGCDSVRVVN